MFPSLTTIFDLPPLALLFHTDQVFPKGATIPANGAVVLCSDTVTVCRAGTTLTNSTLRDTLVFSHDLRLLIKLSATRGQQVMPVLR